MAEDSTTIITFVLLIALAVAVFFEIRFIRSRRKKTPEPSGIDDVYNAIITVRAISTTLKRKGHDTKDADMLIIEAEAAYDRGNYQAARNSIDSAKAWLQDSKPRSNAAIEEEPKHQIQQPAFERSTPDEPYIEPSYEVPFQTAKLPKDYVESKFMITSVKEETAKKKDACDVAHAEECLDQAQRLFEQEKYTESLRYAMKAKHSLEEPPPKAAAPKPVAIEAIPPAKEKDEIEYCKKCNSLVDEGDAFCRRCGEKVVRIPKCPNCGSEVAPDDVFCRKCGNQLKSLFSCPVCKAEVSENDSRCPKCKTPLG